MGENNTPTALKGCGVKLYKIEKTLFIPTVLYELGLFDGRILYKLQLAQPIFNELQLLQIACTSCNF